MASYGTPGSRLLIPLIDEYADKDPNRVWACIPIDDNDVSKGFQDITYAALANAVNHAVVWLKQNLPPATKPFETIAYLGPKDISYPILAVAVAKIGRKLLLPSPFTSITGQAHLLEASECTTYLHTPFTKPGVEKVLSIMSGTKPNALLVPGVEYFLQENPAPKTLFTKSWDEARLEPWLVFHTSGTTGQPKLITYTHQMMATLDTTSLMPDADEENMILHFENKRWYTPLPSLHVVGMAMSLQFTTFLNSILIIGPATPGPPTPTLTRDILHHGAVNAAMLPPALIDAMTTDPTTLSSLRSLHALYFAGAPLTRRTADLLLPYIPVRSAMGSTEAGPYFLRITGDEDWEWYSIRSIMGIEFQPVTEDLYEAVFVQKPELERFQQIFWIFPELQEWRSKDLFRRHPFRDGVWKFVGRVDDMVVLAGAEKVYAKSLEDGIMECKDVGGVLVGGQGRVRPWVLIEWVGGDVGDDEKKEVLRLVFEEVNRNVSEAVKLSLEFCVFVKEGGLVRNGKGSVARRESEELYAKEIEGLFGGLKT